MGIDTILVAIAATVGCGVDSGTPSGSPSAPPPITEPLDTLAGYTQACGVELGPVPGFDCEDGYPLPIVVDGVETDPTLKCDHPSLIRGCARPTRVGRAMGRTWSGTDAPDTTWIFICISWEDTTQIAYIGHHQQTGATCFYEAQKGMPTEAPPPLSQPQDPSSARDDYWETPAKVGEIACPDCHASDPWVHSPYVDQVRDPSDPDLPFVPSGADRGRPYFAVASPFDEWPRQVAIQGNACLQCHRIGTGSSSAEFVRTATGRSKFSFGSAWRQEFPQSHWMPPDASTPTAAEWDATYGADTTALLDCLEGSSQEHCTTLIPSARAEAR